MALSPKFNVSQRCKDSVMVFKDTTGDYDASKNAGGYGSPNIARSGVDSTTIEIKAPDGRYYKTLGYNTDLLLYSTDYLFTAKDTEKYIKAHEFISYRREAKPVTITGTAGELFTVYFTDGVTGNVKITIQNGSTTTAGTISSTTASEVTVKIANGLSTVTQIATLLETHDAVSNVKTSGSAYSQGSKTIIESTDGADYVTKGQLASFVTGCYDFRYRVFDGRLTPSSSLTEGDLYVVHTADPGEYVTYNNVNYFMNETIRATSVSSWTRSNANVLLAKLEAETKTTFSYYCSITDKIKEMILQDHHVRCDKSCDFVQALSIFETELSAALVSLEREQEDCACDSLSDLEKLINAFMARCC